jgi:hypothetical protein
MGEGEWFHHTRLVVHVVAYEAVGATALTMAGMFFSHPGESAWRAATTALILGAAVDAALLFRLSSWGPGKRAFWMKARLLFRILNNAVIIHWLGAGWRPLWVLMLMTCVSTAACGNRGRAILSSLTAAAALSAVHALRGPDSPLGWGEQAAQGLVLVFMSVVVNGLVRLTPRQGPSS